MTIENALLAKRSGEPPATGSKGLSTFSPGTYSLLSPSGGSSGLARRAGRRSRADVRCRRFGLVLMGQIDKFAGPFLVGMDLRKPTASLGVSAIAIDFWHSRGALPLDISAMQNGWIGFPPQGAENSRISVRFRTELAKHRK